MEDHLHNKINTSHENQPHSERDQFLGSSLANQNQFTDHSGKNATHVVGKNDKYSSCKEPEERKAYVVKMLSLLALVLVILGLTVLIAETMRSLYDSYNTVSHSIKWVEQTGLYTAPAVLSKVIIYDLYGQNSSRYKNSALTNYTQRCQIRERANLTRIIARENDLVKSPKLLEDHEWQLCEGPRTWLMQSWLHITVTHGWVPNGLMNTPLGTLMYILPDYEKVKRMTDEELLDAVKYSRLIYINPHTYVEVTLRLLRDINLQGVVTEHLYVYSDRSPGDMNSTQAFISWGSGLYEERAEVRTFSNWSVLISVCALFVTFERVHSVGHRLSAAIWLKKPSFPQPEKKSRHSAKTIKL